MWWIGHAPIRRLFAVLFVGLFSARDEASHCSMRAAADALAEGLVWSG